MGTAPPGWKRLGDCNRCGGCCLGDPHPGREPRDLDGGPLPYQWPVHPGACPYLTPEKLCHAHEWPERPCGDDGTYPAEPHIVATLRGPNVRAPCSFLFMRLFHEETTYRWPR